MNVKLLLAGFFGLASVALPGSANTIAGTPEAAVIDAPRRIVLTPAPIGLAQLEDEEAADADAEKSRKKKGKAGAKMSKALADLPYVTVERPNLRAKHYIYLCSASWCGPCNAEMPHIVEAYEDMKKDKVELILVSADRTEDAARAFLEKYGAEFPAVMSTSSSSLPGFTPPGGIPHAIIVDARGNVLHAGHGSHALRWYEYTGGKKPKARKASKKSRAERHED